MLNKLREIKDLEVNSETKVLLRLDLNVTTNETGEVVNDFRIMESLSTILELNNLGASIIILSHIEKGSLVKVAKYLKSKLQEVNPEVDFEFFTTGEVDKILNQEIKNKIKEIKSRKIILLENIRFDKREKSKSEEERVELAKELVEICGGNLVYINEAFSASHRNHASITAIPNLLADNKKCLGPKFINEIEKLSLALNPQHPSLLIVGGAKFDTKLEMLEKFINLSDKIFVGGALAHTFWKNKNFEIGKSLIDKEVRLSGAVIDAETSGKILLPIDIMVEDRNTKLPSEVSTEERIVDFGPKTLEEILEIAKNSKTITWNGPLDYYEKGYDWGTKELIENLAKMPDKTIILGGGDTVTEIDKVREEKKKIDPNFDFHFTHVSTGGGAMIDFLSNGTLPGIEAIK